MAIRASRRATQHGSRWCGTPANCDHPMNDERFCNWASGETLYTPAMSKPSPGPGWWLASDGNWYPQKWEFTFEYHAGGDSLEKMELAADSLGQQGWEMVNMTYHTGATAVFKRPLAP